MRLFVALDIPDDVRRTLAKLTQELRAIAPEARWVRLEGVHITLKFIGETPPENAERIRAALAQVSPSGPIEMRFAGLGFFPNARRPRVLWAGIEADNRLRELAASIENVLEPLGILREKREFSPHITLARMESVKGLEQLRHAVEKLGSPVFGEARAPEFFLYQSVLKPGGAEYTRLVNYPLASKHDRERTS